MNGRFFLFLIKVWLSAILLNVGAVRLLDDLPAVVYVVLFPLLTLLALGAVDWLDKRVTFIFKWTV